MEKVTLQHEQGDTLEVFLHGAHVTSWKNAAGEELLFTSSKAIFEPPKAIRGGVPVCFPQFGKLGPLGQHGFARNSLFTKVEETSTSVTLAFEPGADQLQGSGPFKLVVRVTLGAGRFWQELVATNTGSSDLTFTAALHTYYKMTNISNVAISGLDSVSYIDSIGGGVKKTQQGTVTFDQEVDRIYLTTPDTILLDDAGSKRRFVIQKSGFSDAVVWNPWIDKAAAMSDFGDEEYKDMVCIEPAVASSGPVVLPPGQIWTGLQYISVTNL